MLKNLKINRKLITVFTGLGILGFVGITYKWIYKRYFTNPTSTNLENSL